MTIGDVHIKGIEAFAKLSKNASKILVKCAY